MSTFTGFSEADLQRIKSGESDSNSGAQTYNKILTNTVYRPQKNVYKYKSPILQNQNSDDAIDNMQFDKCKLSIRSPTALADNIASSNNDITVVTDDNKYSKCINPTNDSNAKDIEDDSSNSIETTNNTTLSNVARKDSSDVTPDVVRCVDNYTEDDLASHRAKLEELQLKQKLMEEQNKKRKEMLSKALADRTKQTEEEVMKLEKIKKDLQVLDGQFSQDVAMLRKKIDLACLSYADAEKHYLRVEKEFLQAKIHLQKEKEKKELLTEHLCALITHNETRKAQKLETLMLELASNKKSEFVGANVTMDDESSVIVDGVDQRTGKIVELPSET